MPLNPDLRLLDLLDGHDTRPALIDGSLQVTRAELREAALRAASHLADLGLHRGDTLAIWLPNGATWLQLLLAVLSWA